MKSLVARAIQQSDDLVLELEYVDRKGVCTRRVVSPIRFLGETHFLALCLVREEVRQFQLDRCHKVRIGLAMNYTMPVDPRELVAC